MQRHYPLSHFSESWRGWSGAKHLWLRICPIFYTEGAPRLRQGALIAGSDELYSLAAARLPGPGIYYLLSQPRPGRPPAGIDRSSFPNSLWKVHQHLARQVALSSFSDTVGFLVFLQSFSASSLSYHLTDFIPNSLCPIMVHSTKNPVIIPCYCLFEIQSILNKSQAVFDPRNPDVLQLSLSPSVQPSFCNHYNTGP